MTHSKPQSPNKQPVSPAQSVIPVKQRTEIRILRLVDDLEVVFIITLNLDTGSYGVCIELDYLWFTLDSERREAFTRRLVDLQDNLAKVVYILYLEFVQGTGKLDTLPNSMIEQCINDCQRILIGQWKLNESMTDGVRKLGLTLEAILENRRREAAKQLSRAGYVYLLKSTDSVYKIGRTATPEDRRRTFSVKLPFQVDFICLIETDDMYKLESELHAKYQDRRLGGEWFALTDDDVAEIKALA